MLCANARASACAQEADSSERGAGAGVMPVGCLSGSLDMSVNDIEGEAQWQVSAVVLTSKTRNGRASL